MTNQVASSLREQAEQQLREWLWVNHGHPVHALYGDDGERQCSPCAPTWDYRRMPLDELVKQAFKVAREQAYAAGRAEALREARVWPNEVAPNVTIACVGCGREIWQQASVDTTLEVIRSAKCSDCLLAALRAAGQE